VDNLRLILLLTGAVVLVLIVVVHKRRHPRLRRQADWRLHMKEPKLSVRRTDDEDLGEDGAWDRQEPYRDEPIQPNLKGLASALPATNEVITLYLCRKDKSLIAGRDLVEAARRAGLSFGEMNIFHRLQEGLERPVFSVANLVAPGDFNPDDWDHFQTPGLTFFAQLPSAMSALDTWDSMLATATRMTELLDAEILDSNKTRLSRKRIGEMREQMRRWDREQDGSSDGG